MTRTLRVALLAVVGAVVGVLGFPGVAAAHVSIDPVEATRGGYTRVSFRVPNEDASASTTKLEVHLPAEHPIASVAVMPVVGWTIDVQRRKLDTPVKAHGGELTEAVSVLTWTAAPDAAIRPGQFQEFPVSLGPLPDTDRLVFKALQTYSDGEVVRWIEEPPADGREVESPAPVLRLKPRVEASAAPGDARPEGSDAVAIGLGAAGLAAGLAGLVLGAVALARTRRRV